MLARTCVSTVTCHCSRQTRLASAAKYPMSATTWEGHHDQRRAQYAKLGMSIPPSETLAGAAQLTSGTNSTPRSYHEIQSRNVCFL